MKNVEDGDLYSGYQHHLKAVLYRRGRLCLSTSCVACGRVELRRHFVKKTAVVAMCVLFVVKYRVRTGVWVEVDDKRLEKRVRSIFLRRFSSN